MRALLDKKNKLFQESIALRDRSKRYTSFNQYKLNRKKDKRQNEVYQKWVFMDSLSKALDKAKGDNNG